MKYRTAGESIGMGEELAVMPAVALAACTPMECAALTNECYES